MKVERLTITAGGKLGSAPNQRPSTPIAPFMPHSIDHLLQQPEGKTLEFKRDLSSPRNVLKMLVAFANAAGGYLAIGVDDARQVLGVSDPLDEEARICNLIADGISPRLVPSVELASVGDRTLLVVEVFLSSARPHYLNSLGPEAGVYVRLGASNRQAGPDWIAETRRAAAGQVFDEQPMPELGLDDLDTTAMARVFGPTRTLDEKSLQTLKLLRTEQGRLAPTRGAVLLFGKTRDQHFPDAVEMIELFLKKHAFKTARFGAMRREDVWSIPLTMLREAIVNALTCSDYAQRGTPIRVALFDNSIDIESPGMLLPGVTIEDMKSGVSRIRNPVIARVFRELGLIEQWGSGVRRIFEEASRQGLPEPVIEEIATGMRLRIRLSQPHALNSPAAAKKRSGANGQVDSSWPSKGVNGGANAGVNEGVNALLALIIRQPGLRVPALASNLHTSPKNVERWLQRLKAASQIEFRGTPKTGGYHAKP